MPTDPEMKVVERQVAEAIARAELTKDGIWFDHEKMQRAVASHAWKYMAHARAAIAATRIAELEAENARLREENERLSTAVCSGVLGDLLTADEGDALVDFVKALRAGSLGEPKS